MRDGFAIQILTDKYEFYHAVAVFWIPVAGQSGFLLKHGQVVCGKDFDQAFERAMFFEMACRIIINTGQDYTVLSKEEIADLDKYILGKVQK